MAHFTKRPDLNGLAWTRFEVFRADVRARTTPRQGKSSILLPQNWDEQVKKVLNPIDESYSLLFYIVEGYYNLSIESAALARDDSGELFVCTDKKAIELVRSK
jgi:hypothetical protein